MNFYNFFLKKTTLLFAVKIFWKKKKKRIQSNEHKMKLTISKLLYDFFYKVITV